ncbi:MAG: hypothetical protein IJR87_08985 [Bacteroidaceae bacterium]|nr:hypothetical protein [Bacteroidaceae bacterium]
MKKNEIGGVRLRKEYVKPALRVVKLQGRSCLLQASQMQINSTDPWPTLPGDPTTPLLPW